MSISVGATSEILRTTFKNDKLEMFIEDTRTAQLNGKYFSIIREFPYDVFPESVVGKNISSFDESILKTKSMEIPLNTELLTVGRKSIKIPKQEKETTILSPINIGIKMNDVKEIQIKGSKFFINGKEVENNVDDETPFIDRTIYMPKFSFISKEYFLFLTTSVDTKKTLFFNIYFSSKMVGGGVLNSKLIFKNVR